MRGSLRITVEKDKDGNPVPSVGFEPTTQGLKGPCSTVELERRRPPVSE